MPKQSIGKLAGAVCVAMFATAFSVANASLEELKERVEALEAKSGGALGGVELYGRFRPSITFRSFDGNGDDTTDIQDHTSRLGVKGDYDMGDGWKTFFRGEWRVRFGDEAEGTRLGDSYTGYVGVGTPLGEVAIGQQWNTYYNIVAEVTDIYQHNASPFGWDPNGPFRTNSLVTYKTHIGNLSIQGAGRFTGGDSDGPHRHGQEYNLGAGYRFDAYNAYLGVAFRNTQGNNNSGCQVELVDATFVNNGPQGSVVTAEVEDVCPDNNTVTSPSNQDTDWWAIGGSINPTDNLYLAFTYQDGERDDGVVINDQTAANDLAFDDGDISSLDIVASYSFGDDYTFIVGYFDSEDDTNAVREFDGFDVSLTKNLNSNTKVWIEWLSSDPDDNDVDDSADQYYADDAFLIGFRYDFSTK